MTIIKTQLGSEESARRQRFEPTGTIASTNTQKAIEEVVSDGAAAYAPISADYIVGTTNGTLTGERVATSTTSITVDIATAGQAKFKRAALTGDVTASADTNSTTIANDAVSNAKMANMATATLKGRTTAGTGDPEDITASAAIDLIGSTRGSVLYRGASGWAILTPGTSGTMLTSAGAGADPSYTLALGSLTGIIKASSGTPSAATAGTDYMRPDTTSALTAGFTSASVSAGTKTTGTYTFDPTAGAVQHVTNGGAHTFAPPATHGAWMLDYVNNGSAGALTTSGWTKVDGDAFDTTNGHAFRCMLSNGNQGSYMSVKRMV